MRTIRALTTALAFVVALPIVAAAQKGRPFKDSWFWGLKTGGFTLADSASNYVQAPVVGIDWLITRTHGGLYFFHQQTFVLRDDVAGLDSGFRPVTLKNMRRLDVALMGFPGEHLIIHPYVGAGFSLMQVVTANAEPPFFSADQVTSAQATINAEKVGFQPIFMGGAQYRFRSFSAFGQLSLSPANKRFLLYNGRPLNFGYELGVRYNFGSSIDRM